MKEIRTDAIVIQLEKNESDFLQTNRLYLRMKNRLFRWYVASDNGWIQIVDEVEEAHLENIFRDNFRISY